MRVAITAHPVNIVVFAGEPKNIRPILGEGIKT
jgi:hypothetical protein